MNTNNLIENIFNINADNQQQIIEQVFSFQFNNNPIFNQWCNSINYTNQNSNYAFLPISFFKTHSIKTTSFIEQLTFESSGTTQTINSKHNLKDIEIYKRSFTNIFNETYGNIKNWCILGLLPNYLERNNSSLVFMVNDLIKQSNHPESGFYLHNYKELFTTLTKLETAKQPTILIGVTFALLEFAEQFKMKLQHTHVIETGGMKGRKKEVTKNEVHTILKNNLGVKNIHSEYGMTELLSQAYATENEKHICPPWMKVYVRSEDDPLDIKKIGKGVINIIDLANIYSCSFIATDDVGEVFEDGSFKIFGRLDNSDLRGCSLLYL